MRGKCWLAAGILTISLSLGYWALAQGPSVLPADAFERLVSQDAKFIRETVVKDKLDKKTGRKVKGAAIMIAQYAQSGMTGANAAEMATLRDHALAIIKAVDDEKLDVARKHAAALSPKPKAEPGVKTDVVSLQPHLELEFIMRMFSGERIGGFGMEKELEDLVEMRGPLPPNQQQKTVDYAYKWAMIATLAQGHPPEMEEGKGKTKKNWMSFAEQFRKNSLALAEAAKMNKEVGAAAAALSKTCTKCHDVFRVP
jgi:hypothetical protein